MTDITKCTGNGGKCPRMDTCWRALAPANPLWQSVMMGPENGDYINCVEYWPVELKKNREYYIGEARRIMAEWTEEDLRSYAFDRLVEELREGR